MAVFKQREEFISNCFLVLHPLLGLLYGQCLTFKTVGVKFSLHILTYQLIELLMLI